MSVIAAILLVIASIVGLQANSVEALIAARIGSGIGVGILATVILAALSAMATPADRGKLMSLYPMANNVGIAFYPLLGGALVGVLRLAGHLRRHRRPGRGRRSGPPRSGARPADLRRRDRRRAPP